MDLQLLKHYTFIINKHIFSVILYDSYIYGLKSVVSFCEKNFFRNQIIVFHLLSLNSNSFFGDSYN